MKLVLAVTLPLAWATASGCSQAGPDSVWAEQVVADTVEARRIEFPVTPSYLQLGAPGLFPDGRALAGAEDETGDLAVMSIDGAVRILTPPTRTELWGAPGYTNGNARVSRDGRRIAYTWWNYQEEIYADLRVIDAAGGEASVVYDGRRGGSWEPTPADWSPDGQWIAVVGQMDDDTWQILLVPSEGGEARLVRALGWDGPNAVSFSPDGRYLAYDRPASDEAYEHDLFVYDLGSGSDRKVLSHPGNDLLLGWSPKGGLLFQSDRSGGRGVWRVAMSGGKPAADPVLVKPDFWRGTGLAFSESGDFYYTVETGGAVVYATEIDPSTVRAVGAPRALTSPGEVSRYTGAVSRDGRLLAFHHAAGLDSRWTTGSGLVVTLQGLEGGERREVRLPPDFRMAFRQRWLPDGSGVFFAGWSSSGQALFRLDVRSSNVQQVLDPQIVGTASLFAFDVTSDGRSLVYRVREEDNTNRSVRARIFVRDLATAIDREIASFPLVPGFAGRLVAASPDGRQVAYFRGRVNAGGQMASTSEADLVLSPVAGGEDAVILEAGSEAPTISGLSWAPDGRAVFINKVGTGIVRIPIDGGPQVEVGVEGDPLGMDPTGTRLYFTANNPVEAELWRLALSGANP